MMEGDEAEAVAGTLAGEPVDAPVVLERVSIAGEEVNESKM